MTLQEPGERPRLPRQQPDPRHNGQGPARPPRKVPRGWKTYLIVALLVLVPLGYLMISAEQSRDSGRDKAEKAGATGLTAEWPSGATRRIYDVPIPRGATDVAWFETNALRSNSLYVEFTTTPERLDRFFENVGAGGDALADGYVPITAKQAKNVGWSFDEGTWSGLLHKQPESAPDVAVAVDVSDPAKPEVRVVSTSEF